MHISSPSSKKSATRPARSSDWLRLSAVPSTFTLRQKSSRSDRIRSMAFFRPSSVRSMPQYSHMMLPSSRW